METSKTSIIDRLIAHAQQSPEATAYIILEDGESVERRILFQDLDAWVRMLAAQLSDKHLQGHRVLLVYQDTLEFIISFLACQYLGIIPVPVPFVKGSKQMARIQNIIEDAQVTAVLCAHFSLDTLQRELSGFFENKEMAFISTDVTYSMIYVPIDQAPVYNRTAFIQYTSGSTAKPKGVVITSDNLLHNQQLIQSTFGCSRDSVIFTWLPFHHDMGLIGNILHTIYVGCTCILMSPLHFVQNPRKWLRAISKYRVTHSGGPNFAYDLCVDRVPPDELPGLDLSSWKVAYNGSEPVRYETLLRFAAYFGPAGFNERAFRPCYGLAEATLLVSGCRAEDAPLTLYVHEDRMPDGMIRLAGPDDRQSRAVVSCGSIAAGMEAKIISLEHGGECEALQEGEICIAGASITDGYWNKDNSAVFYERENKRFLRTGDLGFLYKDQLFVHGRYVEMLVIRGKNVYPYDIEEQVGKCHSAIESNGVAIFCINAARDQWVIAAEIKRAAVKELDSASVIGAIDNTVTGLFGVYPYEIILTSPLAIPRTTSGKLQRLKCKEDFLQGAFPVLAAKSAMPVQTENKQQHARQGNISRYLIDVIGARVGYHGVETVNDKTELTAIGIDSIRATEVINIINKDLGINIDIAKVLQDNSFSGLVNVIEHMLWLKNTETFGEQITI
jgi:acyl-CoA synthetase (AMP-forming)/AMP-acid ligase II/acyl carrier protein